MSKGEGENNGPEAPKGIGLGYVVYQQVAGVIGAFAFIALLSHFFDIDWHGFLGRLVGAWDAYVRPAMTWLLDSSVVALMKWAFDWSIEVPLIVRDYLSVGLVMELSAIRAIFALQRWSVPREGVVSAAAKLFFFTIVSLFIFLIGWPALLYFLLNGQIILSARTTETREGLPPEEIVKYDMRRSRLFVMLTLSPLFYLTLLLAANYLLLRPGT